MYKHDRNGNISSRTALIVLVVLVVAGWYYNKPKYGPAAPSGGGEGV